jgi:hypothetical protein
MNIRMRVYRESAEHPVEPESKIKSSGLLRVSKTVGHVCAPPGLFLRFMLRLIFRPVVWRTLWRCQHCGQVWQWKYHQPSIDDGTYPDLHKWIKTDESVWVEAGGKLGP